MFQHLPAEISAGLSKPEKQYFLFVRMLPVDAITLRGFNHEMMKV